MLIFTITNNVTEDVWVGTCKDSSEERFQQFQEAMALGIKHKFYKDLRDFGVQNFTIEDYAIAEDREELKDLFNDAIEQFEGTSLSGIKTTLGKTSIATAAPLTAAAQRAKSKTATLSNSTRSTHSTTASKAAAPKVARKPVKEKVSTGRTGSANKERAIKERIAQEKAERESLKSKQIMEQADEMKNILAALDARGSTLKKR